MIPVLSQFVVAGIHLAVELHKQLVLLNYPFVAMTQLARGSKYRDLLTERVICVHLNSYGCQHNEYTEKHPDSMMPIVDLYEFGQ